MELLEYKNEFLKLLNAEDISDLPNKLSEVTGDYDFKEQYIKKFGNRDWIREIYQYYMADRTNLKQDYTPTSLAKLCGQIVGKCETIIDLCAGSGSLSINSDCDFLRCVELDESVLPFLKFNLFLHSKSNQVIDEDALKISLSKADGVISNPPFNLPYEGDFLKTGNWAFVYQALSMTTGRAAIILPKGVLTESRDKQAVEKIVKDGNLEAVISCPERMFDSTSIPVCVLVLNASPSESTVFIDGAKLSETYTKEQRGQYGGNSHTGRVYKKQVNAFSDVAIGKIVSAINDKQETAFSSVSSSRTIEENGFCLSPNRYIQQDSEQETQSKFEWIAEQYNQIVRLKNACKLTINETLAKELHFDQKLWEDSKTNSAEVAKVIEQVTGMKLEREDYLTFTRSRELSIRFKSKDDLPAIFNQFVQLWVNQTVMLNQLENAMLAQMRDDLLPQLMNGSLKIPEEVI